MPVPPLPPSEECYNCRHFHEGCDTLHERVDIGVFGLCSSYERRPGTKEAVAGKKFYFGAELVE